MEKDRMAGELAKLAPRVFEVAGLADRAPVEIRDLVGTDNPGGGELAAPLFGFQAGEAYGRVARKLSGQGAFIHVGRPYLERVAQALEEAFAVFGAGS